MKEFETVDANFRINRQGVQSFVNTFGAYRNRGERIICRHLGVDSINANDDGVYSMRGYLEAMRELQDQFGEEFMRTIGQRTSENSVFPPGIDSVLKVMQSFDIAYHLNHPGVPNGSIGNYLWATTSDSSGVMTCTSPYPCSGDVGLIEGMARRFAPNATVEHEPGSGCRHKGSENCRYVVAW